LEFEVVYFVESAELRDYLDAQQRINIDIAKLFEKEKIEFAFPTQTVHLVKS
jgi:small-conductance mechanosensitive channel